MVFFFLSLTVGRAGRKNNPRCSLRHHFFLWSRTKGVDADEGKSVLASITVIDRAGLFLAALMHSMKLWWKRPFLLPTAVVFTAKKHVGVCQSVKGVASLSEGTPQRQKSSEWYELCYIFEVMWQSAQNLESVPKTGFLMSGDCTKSWLVHPARGGCQAAGTTRYLMNNTVVQLNKNQTVNPELLGFILYLYNIFDQEL